MRKLKILSFIMVITMLATVFASCGVSSFKSVFNDDYNFSPKPVSDVKDISELDGYSYEKSNSHFAIFKKVSTQEIASVTYRVFSFINKSVVGDFTSTATYNYEIELCENIPAFVVKGAQIDTDNSTGELSVSMTLYDEKGNSVASCEKLVPTRSVGDMYIFNYVAYVEEKNGGLKKKMDVPEYLIIDQIDESTDEYIYYIDHQNGSFVIYDTEFTPVASWVKPTYVDDVNMFGLNNGDVLVQYAKRLSEQEEKFDFCELDEAGDIYKYDLVTLIVGADGGDVEEIEFDYIINNIRTNFEMYAEDEDNNYFNNDFDNIAYVASIVDGMIDSSESGRDIVLMSNKGKIDGSLKLVDGQTATLPQMLDKGIYVVETVFGGAVVDHKGKVIQYINGEDFSIRGRYIVTDRAIYDSEMKKIYDLEANKAEVKGVIDDTIFVHEKKGNSDAIIAIKGDVKKTITSSTASKSVTIMFEISGYQVYDSTTNNYSYYTVDGELIKTFSSALRNVCASSLTDSVIMSYVTSGGETRYCLFVK